MYLVCNLSIPKGTLNLTLLPNFAGVTTNLLPNFAGIKTTSNYHR